MESQATLPLSPRYEPGSYRDRHGRVFYADGAVYRGLSSRALDEWQLLSSTAFLPRAMSAGKIVATKQLDAERAAGVASAADWAAVLEHEAIPFISYPYEWCFGMLQDAALLELELLTAALEDDFSLKDGSAFNVQWIGAKPIFIDVPSFEKLAPGDPWVGYRQFCQTCLFPLILQAYKDVPFQPWLRGSLDGIDPEQCRNLMSFRDLFRAGVMTHVYLHSKLQAAYSDTRQNVKAELRSAGFGKQLIQANVRGLSKLVRGLTWRRAKSTWSEYTMTCSYSDADRQRKERFVRAAVTARPRKLVWDLGSNTGDYSRIAAESAAYVIAMDSDQLAVERLYRSLKTDGGESRRILPLISNLADSSPNLGWRGLERKSLAERGRPDMTLALALIHHIVLGANIPLREFIEWLAALGTDLVIEFVSKADPMVQTLLRNKRDDYADYEPERFERWLADSFEVVRREPLESGTRTLYHAVAKSRGPA